MDLHTLASADDVNFCVAKKQVWIPLNIEDIIL